MIVFITGASAGFGAAMARTFVKNGHQVVLAARRKDRLESLARELGESALPVAMSDGMQPSTTFSTCTAFHSCPLAEWMVDRIR